jgi:hypothetical protein
LFGQLGSLYGSAQGHYLLVGPNWQGDVPDGIVDVFRSPTPLANAIPRIFMDAPTTTAPRSSRSSTT